MKINVRVKPGAGRNLVKRISDGEYRVEVRARAEEGKANLAVRKLLAKETMSPYADLGKSSKECGVSVLDVKIKTLNGRNKIVEVKK